MVDHTSDKHIEPDADEFLDWAEEIAESEEVSMGKIFDQLVSAYWIRTELQRTLSSVADTSAANQLPHEQNDTSSEDNKTEQQPLPTKRLASESKSESASVSAESGISESGPEYNGSKKMSDESSEKELWQRLYDLSDELDQNRRSQTERWIRIRDRVESIEQQVNMVENENKSGATNSTSGSDTRMSDIRSEIDLIKENIEQLKESREESLELQQELEQRINELEESQEAIRSRIDDEFDSIENAFEAAINRQEKIETRRSQLTDQIEDNTDTIESINNSQENLEDIRQAALKEGIENADCDYCSKEIKISMLTSPECPFCETPFNDIDPGGWSPFNSNILTGAPRDLSADDPEDFNSFLNENTSENGIN
ncbi:hypothetical protein [Haloquadratum walsbyi]|jgi:Chromosome segregation ATPases|uniref:Uncharacterized protein n=1 Tax=Haloquadratum walsbyi J07HQW2 TaxID=1238425 RepID=U1NCE6_9EURY|nr:hypothetical protein [Haloquadratum walsbyi]ERG94600.1 MAG: hypothetical protein J07HQW2_01036 [Haloquadratum walsbyi J07HQW2]